ncbi:DotA/TraY family protein [Burkholderia contaminans]|uniref:DotA/TraY family protein n=1 Tax=Burkholderia contaminans TaxID=488447 RepID=UPI001CF4C792|nr:DotA/TraY family protein [Burkholderia contaminans]MCA7885506.1 DotA/TraY family protein [Burkholderia contaminans]
MLDLLFNNLPEATMRRHLKTLAGPLALFALLMFSGTAHANDIFTAPSTDWTMKYILVPLFGQGLTFADSPLASMMSIFNSAVLFIGGILAAYTIIAGTASTAHDGEVLGKKWSSMWVPVRTALGTAAILPVLNGFCVAQALILWLAMQGVGLADTLWTNYLQNFQQHAVYHNVALDAKLRSTFESMVLSNVCYESVVAEYNGTPADQKDGTQYLAGTSDIAGSVGATWFQNVDANGEGSAGYNFGQTNSSGPDTSACGSVTLKLTGTSQASDSQSSAVPLTAQNLIDMPAVTSKIEQAHVAGLKAMQTAAHAAALQFLNMGSGDSLTPSTATVNAAINAGVAAYSSAVSAVAQQAFTDSVNQNMVSAMAQDGWASAGSSYMRVMKGQSDVNAAVANLPIGVDGTSAGTIHFLQLHETRTDADVARAKSVLAAADRENQGNVTDGNTDGFSELINVLTGKSWFGVGTFDPNEDPIITASSLGQGMIYTAGAFGTAAAGLTLTAAIPAAGQVTVAAASLFGGFFTACLGALLLPGAALAYGEPMIPFIMSVAVLISWIVMLLEAIVAAPLAAVMLLNPHQEAFGGLEKAMSLTVSVTLRPALMIFGLVGSILVMSPIGYFVNSFFGWAFSTTPGGFLALIKMLAGAMIYGTLLIAVTYQVFMFMLKLPDTVLEWMGSGGHGAVMGSTGSTMKQGTGGAVAAGIGAAAGIASRGSQGAGDLMKAVRDKRKARERESLDLSRGRERGTMITVPIGPTSPAGGRGDLPPEPSTLKDAKASAAASGDAGKPAPATAQTGSANAKGAAASTQGAPEASADRAASGSQDPATASRADLMQRLGESMGRAAAIRDRLVEPNERPTEANEKPESSAARDAKPAGTEDGGTL